MWFIEPQNVLWSGNSLKDCFYFWLCCSDTCTGTYQNSLYLEERSSKRKRCKHFKMLFIVVLQQFCNSECGLLLQSWVLSCVLLSVSLWNYVSIHLQRKHSWKSFYTSVELVLLFLIYLLLRRREWSCGCFCQMVCDVFLADYIFYLGLLWNLISLMVLSKAKFLIFCFNSWEKIGCLYKMINSAGLKCFINKRKQILCYCILSSYLTVCWWRLSKCLQFPNWWSLLGEKKLILSTQMPLIH